MRIRRILLILALGGLVVAFVAWPGTPHSDGAPPGSAMEGCSCHGPASNIVNVTLAGVPERYTQGETYNLTFHFFGSYVSLGPGLLNQGGFAVAVGDGGTLMPAGDDSQVVEGMLTHTEAGNDQRRWPFLWQAPTNGTPEVTFHFAGSVVNGNNLSDPGDQWQTGTLRLQGMPAPPPPPQNNTTAPATTTKGGAPGPGVFVAGAGLVAAAWLSGRLRRSP